MKAVVISNCVTAAYYNTLRSLFPDWEIKAAGINESLRWLESGEKPQFLDYLESCDLFVGLPIQDNRIDAHLNPSAERVYIPELYFRGLHPDIALANGVWGPFSEDTPHTQVSLIVLAAYLLGKTVAEAEAYFRRDCYVALGYPDLFEAERIRLCDQFDLHGIDIRDEFQHWQSQGDFFYICHHPRSYVLVDIIRSAFKKRLSFNEHRASESLRTSVPDHLSWSESWPVYPELASMSTLR